MDNLWDDGVAYMFLKCIKLSLAFRVNVEFQFGRG